MRKTYAFGVQGVVSKQGSPLVRNLDVARICPLLQSFSQGYNQDVTHLKAKLMWLLAVFSSLWALGLRPEAALSFLLHGPLSTGAVFIGSSNGERVC